MNKTEIIKKLNEWIEIQRLDEYAKKTIVDYKHGVELFIGFIDGDNFILNKDLLIKYKEFLMKKYEINSINKYITIINKFLKFIGYENCTIKKLKKQRKTSLDEPIWEQEHKRMLRWAKKLNLEDMYFIIEIFAYTGCRVDELKFFTVENLNSNYIKKVYNKGKERTIILRNDLKRDLKKYCKEKNIKTGCIFRSPANFDNPNKCIPASTIWRRLKKIAKAARINPKKIYPHAWRHLFAKKAKEAGIELDELQDILGHSDIRTTAIYTQTSNVEKKIKIEKIKY